MKISIQDQDNKFMEIQELIELKRKMLYNKQHKLKTIIKQNAFLEEVKNDYITYYDYISKQKHDQIKALDLLNVYISDLTNSGNLSKHNIEDAKFEQKKILKEVKLIQNGLNSLINNTKNI
jgi:hypothetical protein